MDYLAARTDLLINVALVFAAAICAYGMGCLHGRAYERGRKQEKG